MCPALEENNSGHSHAHRVIINHSTRAADSGVSRAIQIFCVFVVANGKSLKRLSSQCVGLAFFFIYFPSTGPAVGMRHVQALLIFLNITTLFLGRYNAGVSVVAMTNADTTNPNFTVCPDHKHKRKGSNPLNFYRSTTGRRRRSPTFSPASFGDTFLPSFWAGICASASA